MAYLILYSDWRTSYPDQFSWDLHTSCDNFYLGCRSIRAEGPWLACFRSWGHPGPHTGTVGIDGEDHAFEEWTDG